MGRFSSTVRRQRPYLMAGWLWYLVTLVPVIGLVQVGAQSHADRYTYIPLIGITVTSMEKLSHETRPPAAPALRLRIRS